MTPTSYCVRICAANAPKHDGHWHHTCKQRNRDTAHALGTVVQRLTYPCVSKNQRSASSCVLARAMRAGDLTRACTPSECVAAIPAWPRTERYGQSANTLSALSD